MNESAGSNGPDNLPSERQLALTRELQRGHMHMILAKGTAVALCIGATFLPLLPVVWIAEAIAGRRTKFELALGVSIVIGGAAFTALTTWLTCRAKGRRQSEELIRLRDRCEKLEADKEKLLERLANQAKEIS